MSPARSLAPLALATILVAPAVRAGDETQRLASGVEGRVWSPWPGSVHKGWAPIFVELRNERGEEREVEIDANCGDYGSHRSVTARVVLPPEASAALELVVPLGAVYTNEYYVELRCEDQSTYYSGVVGSSSTSSGFRSVLLLSEVVPEAGALERWSETLSSKTIETSRFVMGPTGMVPAPPAVPNDVDLARAPFAGMPAHQGAYSSLDLVVLDSSRGLPGEAQLAALLAWVRTGGDLLVTGPRAHAAAEAVPAMAAWMEPRFETMHDEGTEFRCGLGRLFVGGLGELDTYDDWVREILAAEATLTPEDGPWRGAALVPLIPGLDRLPYRAFAGLLLLFALVIGPVNFLAVRRRRKPVLLLLTIPAIALVTTIVLLAYGILFQGIDVKSASYSVAVLDQREHRAACVESRQFFAGLAPAAGLVPGQGTIVHPMRLDARIARRRRFEVELAGGTLLAGDFLPSRAATNQVLAVERAERARLDVRRNGAGLSVANNLGVEIEELIVCDPEGGLYALEIPLASGASTELRGPDDGVRAHLDWPEPSPLALLAPGPTTPRPPPGCYLARLASSPFRDDCGIEMNELESGHVVLGVLALEPEAWR